MKKIVIIIILLLAVVFTCSIFFFNPKRLTPEDPCGKTIYYTVIENKNVIINNDNRHEYTLATQFHRKQAVTRRRLYRIICNPFSRSHLLAGNTI